MKQQELADKIGINMQSLSKIERGVNYPTFDTLEKIMDVLGVTPNELLSGEWKYIDHTEPYIMDIIKREQDFNVSLDYLFEKARGHMLPFGWIHLLKALKSKPKVIDLYLTGVLPEYQSKGVNALLFNDLIPVYKRIGAVYAESNPELETNSAVQAQWDYFKREHHKSRRAYIKKL